MSDLKLHRPGDYILDRYMPGATPEQREVARENLRRLAKLLLRVHERLVRVNPQPETRVLPDGEVNYKSRGV